ncbi:oxoglutarate dehydrogenase (Succinyl-transferrin g), E1 component, partial [Mycobacterium sp. PO2]
PAAAGYARGGNRQVPEPAGPCPAYWPALAAAYWSVGLSTSLSGNGRASAPGVAGANT